MASLAALSLSSPEARPDRYRTLPGLSYLEYQLPSRSSNIIASLILYTIAWVETYPKDVVSQLATGMIQ